MIVVINYPHSQLLTLTIISLTQFVADIDYCRPYLLLAIVRTELACPRVILFMDPANERRRYKSRLSLPGHIHKRIPVVTDFYHI